MKIEKIALSKILRVVSVMAQVCIAITFSLLLTFELELIDYRAYPINIVLLAWVLLSCFVGCLGASIVFCNLTQVRAYRPDFALLVFICLLPMASFQYIYGVQNVSIAPVNDVSTNLSDPPQFKLSRAQRQSPYYNQNIFFLLKARDQISAHPNIATVTLMAPPDVVYKCALRAAQSLYWKVSIRDPVAHVFEAKASVRFINNELDTIIRVRDAREGYSSVDVRSASASKRIDGGLNALVIENFITALKRTLVNRRMFEYC
mgnify:CR=1 FL=1|jgi:hypothetical protein